MNVLIITHTKDGYCTPLVVDAVKRKGGRPICLNTDLFPTEERLVLGYGKGITGQRLITAEGSFDLDDLAGIYVRRFRVGEQIPAEMDRQLRAPSMDESRRTIYGLLFSGGRFVLDPFENVQHAENKALQLALAREVGLEIPPTLISNDAEEVAAFAKHHGGDLITKMQSSFRVFREGREHVVFTNTLAADQIGDLEGLALCPMMFQTKIPKKLELRVTVVGRQIFAASIDSQAHAKTEEDWRRDGVSLVDSWRPYALPEEVAAKILALMDRIQLNYGALDVILTPDDRHVFIEVNPVGEWFWLDAHAGFHIADALAEVLLGSAARRDTDLYGIRGEVAR